MKNKMKKLIVMMLFISAWALHAAAQQKSKTEYMCITITEYDGLMIGNPGDNMIITRTDSAQLTKRLDFRLHTNYKVRLAAHEALLFNALTPYFNSGWKLVSTTTSLAIADYTKMEYRYYFSKED